MPEQECNEADLDRADQGVRAHEVGEGIEIGASIVVENLRIDITVYNQKDDEKESGCAHEELLTDGGGKGGFPIHKGGNDLKMTRQR